jgi:hypothetical protein
MEYFQKGADSLLDPLLITTLDGSSQVDPFIHLLVTVRVLERIMESLGQIIGDETVFAGKEFATVLRHFPSGKIAGKTIHNRQIEFGRKRLKQVVYRGFYDLVDGKVDIADKCQAGICNVPTPREKRPFAIKSFMIWMVSGSLIFIPPTSSKATVSQNSTRQTFLLLLWKKKRCLGRLPVADQC